MEAYNWIYDESTLQLAQEASSQPGRKLKGCIEILIVFLKVDHVKQIQDCGVKGHGMKLTKSRPSGSNYDANEKYIPPQPGQFTFLQVSKTWLLFSF